MRGVFFYLLFFLTAACSFAQGQTVSVGKEGGMLFGLSYGWQIPGGDLKERFGSNFYLGSNIDYFRSGSNWVFSAHGGFLFGTDLKEDVLQGLRTRDGGIIANDRSFADIQLRERGFFLGAGIGYLFPFENERARFGLLLKAHAGLLQHKIRIQDDPIRFIPQLDSDYKKGYDRLTNGPYFGQFLGIQYLANDRRINFYFGLEGLQAITQNRRSYNFDTQTADTSNRLDLLWGAKVGWIIPLYFGYGEDIYY